MSFLSWIIVGGIIGWLASIVMNTNAQQGLFLNIMVGIFRWFVFNTVLWCNYYARYYQSDSL